MPRMPACSCVRCDYGISNREEMKRRDDHPANAVE